MFLTPSKTDERVPSQQGTRKDLRKEFWVWPKGEIYLFRERGGGEGGRKKYLTNSTYPYQLFKTSNPLRHPEFTHSFHGQIIFFQISQPAKNLLEVQIF